MECRFCGQGFDTSRGLHVHQAQAHDDVEKEIRKFLDSSPEEIAESLDETELDTEELIEAEQRLADRDEVLQVLTAEDSLSPEDMDEKIEMIDDIKQELESSLKIQSRRDKLVKRKEELNERKKEIERQLEGDIEIREEEKKDLEELKDRKQELEEKTEELRQDIKDLKKEEEDVKKDISAFKQKKRKMRKKINKLYRRVSEL